MRKMSPQDLEWIAGLDCGSVVLTVAPNIVAPEQIRILRVAGINVCLGHAEATSVQVTAAVQAGATGFTHLYNAMSQLNARDPAMVGTAFCTETYAGLIADGFHVHDDLLKLAIKMKPGKIMLVTDAMSSAAGGADQFLLQGRKVTLSSGRLTLPDGTLAGSNLTMDAALRHCVNALDLPLEQALPLTSTNAAAFLGLAGSLGRIAPGYFASLVHLDSNLNVQQTWVDGK
jgi:N-acetylglucosamine-6-phosphate deacetylase